MVEIPLQTHEKPNDLALSTLALRQQGADYARPMGVAPPVPCDVSAVSITATRLLRLPELLARLGICRATIYLHISKGTFPKPIALSPRAVGWLEHEIDAWLMSRIQARDVTKR